MFTIRQAHLAALSQAVQKDFEDRMVAHLGEAFPGPYRALGEQQAREMIQHGIRQAAGYDIVVERDVCQYIDLMMIYGTDFDRDDRYPWAAAILTDPATADPSVKVRRLYAVKDFEDRMVVHLGKFFPKHCEALGETKVREAVHEGIRRAGGYGIVAERDVCKYIDLMFAFDRGFDKDSRYPWAARILTDPAQKDPTAKVNRLYDTALDHVRQAAGINN